MTTGSQIRKKLEKVFSEIQAETLSEIITDAYNNLANNLAKVQDFNELKAIVKKLAEAQERTGASIERLVRAHQKSEERLSRLEAAVEVLTESQRKSEERLSRLEAAVEVLTESQRKSEERLSRLEAAVEALTESQRKSEERLSRLEAAVEVLTESQRKSEERLSRLETVVEGLAEAQRRTEQELQRLIQEHSKTREQVGGLSITIGYILENEAYKALPRLLKEDYGLTVRGKLRRRYVTDNRGRPIELNIIGEAFRDGERVMVVGESKSQLSRRGVDEFIKKKLRKIEGVYKEIFPVLVTHMVSGPEVEDYARGKGIALYYSYDF